MPRVEPRPAATVVVARDAGQGIQVLVVRRSTIGFAPGFVVFPGGVVDDADHDLAARWFGDRGEAARACAVRELHEETGLLLSRAGLASHARRISPGDPGFDPPRASDIPEIARWVAPEALEVRFDARFFAVAAPPDVPVHPDGAEVEQAWWAEPAEVLEASTDGRAALMWPTLVTLDRLAGCGSARDVLALRIEQIAPGADAGIRGAWRRPEWGLT